MITNITLENFKCFRQVSINPKLLTVLIGPNGTGKSSILQALLLLKQSVGEDHIILEGDSINLSGADDLIPNFISDGPVPFCEIHVGVSPGKDKDIRNVFVTFSENLCLLVPYEDLLLPTEVPDSSSRVGRVLSQLTFVPAIRGFSRPRYRLGTGRSQQLPLHLAFDGQEEQLATNLVYSRPSEGKLSKAIERVTETEIRAEMIPSNSIAIKSVIESRTVNIVAEGSGTNALILPFHQLLEAEKGATVLIEEPEIHLHPKAQAELAEVLAETAKAEDKQIIMTTHSEYVAGRLLTLVAEGKLTTEDLAIYSFLKDKNTGECTATEIEVTERGQTKGGLTGFHEATRDEMRRYADGLRNRV